MYLVSKCLLGINCKYNGKNNKNEKVLKFLDNQEYQGICPECFANLSIPRVPAEIVGGDGQDVLNGKAKVLNKNSDDLSKSFIIGALKTLKIAEKYKPKLIILKANSPSCGCGNIYDGTFSGNIIEGNGVTATLLLNNNFRIITENDL